MKRKLLFIIATLSVTGMICLAGWDHSEKQTRWVDRPTTATCWLRCKGELIPSQRVQVFNDTIRYYQYDGHSASNIIDTGYWYIDSNGDIVNQTTVTTILCPTNSEGTLSAPGSWSDCEWTIDMDGDLVPKE